MVKAGLVRTADEDLVDALKQVGEMQGRLIRHDQRRYPNEAVARGAQTWQEAHQVACETERRVRDTEATRHQPPSSRHGAMKYLGAYAQQPDCDWLDALVPPADLQSRPS